MWFHDFAPRGRDNVAGRTISRLALTITQVGTIPRPGHDIVGKPTILPRGPTISRAGSDIAPRERYRTHARYRQCARPDIRSIRTISCVTPTITRVGTISRRDHDIVGLRTISPRGPRHRNYPRYHSLSRDIGTGARYRRPPTISCASYDIANRPTKSRILTISRPPRQYRTNRGVVMKNHDAILVTLLVLPTCLIELEFTTRSPSWPVG